MGSAPSSNQTNKDLINVVEINPSQKISISNNKQSPQKSPQDKNKKTLIKNSSNLNNEQFKQSIEQMKFSQRNDLFKQKSKQTMIELNNALNNLKKNQLLSTMEFKRLQKTEHLVPGQMSKSPLNGQKRDIYQYKKVKPKRSQLAVRQKRTQSSINVSSLTSTNINEGLVVRTNQREQKASTKTPEGIVQLLVKKRDNRQIKSQNSNQRNVFDYQAQQVQSIQNNNLRQQQERKKSINHEFDRAVNRKKKKTVNIKSEKLIGYRFEDNNKNYWDVHNEVVMEQIAEM